jgi:hypothetical protein
MLLAPFFYGRKPSIQVGAQKKEDAQRNAAYN